MTKRWTPEQRAKFQATMAAKAAPKRAVVKRSPRAQPDVIYRMAKGGRLERLRLRTIKVYLPE